MKRLSNNEELEDVSNLEALKHYHQGFSSPSTNSKQNITTTLLNNECNAPQNHRKPSINRYISVSTKTTTQDEQQVATQQSTTTSVPRTSITTQPPAKSTAQRIFRTSLLAVRSARMFAFAGKQRSDQGLDELKLSQLLTQLLTLPLDLKDPQHAEIMIAILSKKNKSLLESQYLSRCLLNLSLFSQNLQILADPASQRVILSEISYVVFPKGHAIFRFGEYGNHYYVVLKGSVFCFIPKPEFKDALLEEQINLERQVIKMKQHNTHKRTSVQADAQQQSAGETNSILNTQQIQQEQGQQQQQKLTDGIHEIILKTTNSQPNQQRGSSLGIIKHEAIPTDEFEQASLSNPEMSLVKVYNPGEAFGEIALMTKERRTATMVCREDSHLMVLSKEGFDRIIGKCEEGQVRQRVSFLKSFAFFASVGDSQLMSLLHFFTETVLHQKTVIYKEGDQVNSIYFIRQGEVHIQKHLDQLQNGDGLSSSGQIHEHTQAQHSQLTQIEQEQQYGQKQKRKILTLKILGPSQYFGQDEIFSHQSQRSLRAIALQSTVLLQISKRDLFPALKQYKQLDTFRSQNDMKQQWQKEREREYIATTEQIPQVDLSSNFALIKSQLSRIQSPQLYSAQVKRNHGSSTFSALSPLHTVAPGLSAVQNHLIFSTSFAESFGQKSQAKNKFLSTFSARDQHSDTTSITQDKTTNNKTSSHITSFSTLSFRKIPEQLMVSTNTTTSTNSSRIQLTSPQNKLSACFSTKTIHVPHFKSTGPVSKNNLTLPSVKQFVSEDIPQQHIEILQQFQQNNQHNEEIMNQLLKKQTENNVAGYLHISSPSISRLPVFHQLTRFCQSPSTPKLFHNLKNPTETASSSISSRSRSNHIKHISSQSQKDMLQTSISNSTSSRFSSSCRQIKAESDTKIPKQLLNYLLNLPNSSTSSQKIKKTRNSSQQGNNALGSSSNLETSIYISPLSAPNTVHDELLQELKQQQQQSLRSQKEDHINEDYDKNLGDLCSHINSRSLSSSDKHNQQQQHMPVVIQQEDCRSFAASKFPQIKRVFKNKKPFYFKLIEQNKIDPIQSICSQREVLPK